MAVVVACAVVVALAAFVAFAPVVAFAAVDDDELGLNFKRILRIQECGAKGQLTSELENIMVYYVVLYSTHLLPPPPTPQKNSVL
jgi:hypothetical protein